MFWGIKANSSGLYLLINLFIQTTVSALLVKYANHVFISFHFLIMHYLALLYLPHDRPSNIFKLWSQHKKTRKSLRSVNIF